MDRYARRVNATTTLSGGIALALLTAVCLAVVLLTEHSALADALARVAWGPFAIAAAVYLGAHLVRALRMVIVLGDSARSMRDVVVAHAGTAAAAALVPFKLGELVRIVAFGRASKGPVHGLTAVWIERTFDAAVITAVGAGAMMLRPDAVAHIAPVWLVAAAFLIATAMAITVLPENIGMVKAFLLRRYTTDWSLRALDAAHRLREALHASRRLIRGKVATLGMLTALLWLLEAVALAMLVEGVVLTATGLTAGILSVLSHVVAPIGHAVQELDASLPIHRLVILTTLLGLFVAAAAYRTRRREEVI